MIWIIAAFILTICVVVYVGRADDEWYFASIIAVPLLIAFLFLGCIGAGITGCIVLNDNDLVTTKSSEVELYALQDGQETVGGFCLGSGYEKGTLYYYYVVNTEKGYKTERISSEDAYIQYTNGTPKLVTYSIDMKPENHDWRAIWFTYYYYVFEVPNDTIITEYNVDLK